MTAKEVTLTGMKAGKDLLCFTNFSRVLRSEHGQIKEETEDKSPDNCHKELILLNRYTCLGGPGCSFTLLNSDAHSASNMGVAVLR